eukprot:scaffold7544_cov107-Isochrysis_galbana.AAC.9
MPPLLFATNEVTPWALRIDRTDPPYPPAATARYAAKPGPARSRVRSLPCLCSAGERHDLFAARATLLMMSPAVGPRRDVR